MARLSASTIDSPAKPEERIDPPIFYGYEFLNPYDADERKFPYDGTIVIISDDDTLPGVPAVWRTSRKRVGWRWVPYGNWVIPLTRTQIDFEPKFWRKFLGLQG
jgi:hypothetical protein